MVIHNKFLSKSSLQVKDFYKYLYETYYASLCHYARKILKDIVDEEDVVQDVFVKLWEKRIDWKEVKTIDSFLYRTVHNACFTILRDSKEIRVDDKLTWDSFVENTFESNEQLLIEEEYYRLVHQMINNLPKERRDVMLLALDGKKNDEIALELNISVNTVKTLKKKVYSYLRERLPIRALMILLLIMENDF